MEITNTSGFKDIRRGLELSVFEAAYLLNTSPRTVRRWEDSRHERMAPDMAIAVLDAVRDGRISPEWWDFRSHGVDTDEWRPNGTLDGVTNIEAGIILRHQYGADALAYPDITMVTMEMPLALRYASLYIGGNR